MSFDNIYSFATCKLKFQSNSLFSVFFPKTIQITQLFKGVVKESCHVESVDDKGLRLIEIIALGFINEIPIGCGDNISTVESYGMQYFPFLSSKVQLNFKVHHAEVGAISISFPDKYRVIWFRQKLDINDKTLTMSHSQGEKESVYVFIPQESENIAASKPERSEIVENINGNIPVRMGGKEYLRIVTFPSLYFCISLIVVAILALQDKPNLTFGAVAAAWVLMLRHFNSANAPQLNTVLRDIYFLLGGLLLLWAICWEKFELKAIAGIPIILLLYWGLKTINVQFSREGVLPVFVENFFYKLRRKNENKNKS